MSNDILLLVTEVAELSRRGKASLELSRSRAQSATASGSDGTDAIAAFNVFNRGLEFLRTAYQTLDMRDLPFSYLPEKENDELRRFRQVEQGAEAIAVRNALDIPELDLGACMKGTVAAVKAILPLVRSLFQTGDRLLGAHC